MGNNFISTSLENQFIYPNPRGSKLIFFAPLGDGVNEENQWVIYLIALFSKIIHNIFGLYYKLVYICDIFTFIVH
jgi:hypothetical protein